MAAGLRGGVDPGDIRAMVAEGPSRQERDEYRKLLIESPKTDKPLAPALARHLLPGNGAVGVAMAGLLPRMVSHSTSR